MHKLAGTQEGQDIFSLASDFLPVGTLDTLHKTTGLPPSLWMATARPHTTQSVSRCIECQLGRWQDEDGENPKPTACKHVTSEFCHDTLFVPLSEFLGRVLEFVNDTDFHMIAKIGSLPLVLPPLGPNQKQNRWYWWHGGLLHGSWEPLARAPVTLARQIVEYELETAKTHEPLLQIRLGFVAPASEKTKNDLEETTAALRTDFVEYTHTHTFHADVAPLNLSSTSLGPQDYVQWDFCIALWDPLTPTKARGFRKFRKAHNDELPSYLERTKFERQNHYSTENEFDWSWRHNV